MITYREVSFRRYTKWTGMHFLHLCMPLYHPDWPFATHFCMACQNWSWNVYKSCKIRLHVSWPALGDLLTSRPSCKDFSMCLPVNQRVVFKLLTFIHKYIYGGAPYYLHLERKVAVRSTRQSTALTLKVTSAKRKNCGDRSSVHCMCTHNSLEQSSSTNQGHRRPQCF